MTRIEQLEAWGLSAALVKMASGEPPHPLFADWCDSLSADIRTRWSLIDGYFYLDDPGNIPSAELLKRDYCGGDFIAILNCGHDGSRLWFWNIEFSPDEPEPVPPIAHSEQGLWFWLFFDFIELLAYRDPENAERLLQEAAASVGFGMLEGVLAFQEGFGAQPDVRERLRELTVTL